MAKKTKAEIKQEALEAYQIDIARDFIRNVKVELEKASGKLSPKDIPSFIAQFTSSLEEIKTNVSDTEDALTKISTIIGG